VDLRGSEDLGYGMGEGGFGIALHACIIPGRSMKWVYIIELPCTILQFINYMNQCLEVFRCILAGDGLVRAGFIIMA
jgi:hypothetical protein